MYSHSHSHSHFRSATRAPLLPYLVPCASSVLCQARVVADFNVNVIPNMFTQYWYHKHRCTTRIPRQRPS